MKHGLDNNSSRKTSSWIDICFALLQYDVFFIQSRLVFVGSNSCFDLDTIDVATIRTLVRMELNVPQSIMSTPACLNHTNVIPTADPRSSFLLLSCKLGGLNSINELISIQNQHGRIFWPMRHPVSWLVRNLICFWVFLTEPPPILLIGQGLPSKWISSALVFGYKFEDGWSVLTSLPTIK